MLGESIYKEQSHKGHNRQAEIARSRIVSQEYASRIGRLDELSKVKNAISDQSRFILFHRNGTLYEDLVYIDSQTGKFITRTDFNRERGVLPSNRMKRMLKQAGPGRIIALHNHPGSSVPSPGDIGNLIDKQYKYGLVVCHNGDIYKYSLGDNPNIAAYSSAIAFLDANGYNENAMRRFADLAKSAGVIIEIL